MHKIEINKTKLESQLQLVSRSLGQHLRAGKRWLTCAESCTGGLIAKALTDISGSSAYFDRGFVTYSNQSKQEMLGVQQVTLEQQGAVSEAVVIQMAQGALKAAGADIALSVTGVAGPDGGSIEKPVGTVWFGWADNMGRVRSERQIFSGDRESVRLQAALYALQQLQDNFLSK